MKFIFPIFDLSRHGVLLYVLLLLYSEELDEDLLSYLRQLIMKQEERSGGLEPTLNENNELEYDPSKKSRYPSRPGASESLDVLKMIQRRVVAEIRTMGNLNLKLLNDLIRMNPNMVLLLSCCKHIVILLFIFVLYVFHFLKKNFNIDWSLFS